MQLSQHVEALVLVWLIHLVRACAHMTACHSHRTPPCHGWPSRFSESSVLRSGGFVLPATRQQVQALRWRESQVRARRQLNARISATVRN